jgi:hypothetical protein
LGRACKFRRVAPIRIFGSLTLLRYQTYFFWESFCSDWLIWCSDIFLRFWVEPANSVGDSPHTNFWLLYTSKVLNILFFWKFLFWLVDLMLRQFFEDFGSCLQIPSDSPHTNFWLLYTFKVLNILFWESFCSDWLIWCTDNFFKILGRAQNLQNLIFYVSFFQNPKFQWIWIKIDRFMEK